MAQTGIIVVTGAANGIGASLSLLAAAKGYGVVAVDIDATGLEGLAAASAEITTVAGDVSDPLTVKTVADTVRALGQKLSGLVNNAAAIDRRTLDQVQPDSFRQMMSVNCLGPLLMIQALTDLLKRDSGRVVNIGSMNIYGGEPHLLEYSMSKAALACMTRNLAPQLAAHGIRICQVNPGWVLTPLEDKRKQAEGWEKGWHEHPDPKRVPFGRLIKPEEVAEFLMFMFSDTCTMMNGSVLDFSEGAHGMAGRY